MKKKSTFEFQWSGVSPETMWTTVISASLQPMALPIKSNTSQLRLINFTISTFFWKPCTSICKVQRLRWSDFVSKADDVIDPDFLDISEISTSSSISTIWSYLISRKLLIWYVTLLFLKYLLGQTFGR